uniref:Uncharacterized protein n=1 Tax=Arundo donax TaxID=35708 RepID=A0A0A9CA95_ARUDO
MISPSDVLLGVPDSPYIIRGSGLRGKSPSRLQGVV